MDWDLGYLGPVPSYVTDFCVTLGLSHRARYLKVFRGLNAIDFNGSFVDKYL